MIDLNIFDNDYYAKLAVKSHKKYINNKPFPHICFDNFLPEDVALILAKEYPNTNNFDKNWKIHDNKNVERYFLEDSSKFKENLRIFSMLINSRKFLLFLETLTGIETINPDPYFMGGGAMSCGNGGFLNIHADFNFHHKLQLWRRCNVLFYLTPNWKDEWGGKLELWSNDKKEKVVEIEPYFNRMVIFSTTSESFHGQPVPTKTPDNVYRNVFSSFYYTTDKDEKTLSDPHYTKYSIEKNEYAKKIGNDYKSIGEMY